MTIKLLQPILFKEKIRKQKVSVFLCGPGYDTQGFKVRQNVRKHLESYGCEVKFGEDLSSKSLHIRKSDLQTIEVQFSVSVDFTILLLESPGSIAELGTFTMMENVRPRLFVLVPSRFFGAESYIARGPLSLISSSHQSNISYFSSENDLSLKVLLDRATSLYKYARHIGGLRYIDECIFRTRSFKLYQKDYDAYFSQIRDAYYNIIVLSCILIIDEPTFADITDNVRIPPKDVAQALKRLFVGKSIIKQGSRYYSLQGFSDPVLSDVNTTALSHMRALHVAA